ncbi:MAG: hypothetical protein R2732_03420 [Microbacteriaceae bacterium]|jgi:hypothetical protein|nr:hypothetical protein [Microbacteriaceae bacterium]HPZ34589.1 hypothetical protein [Microbacteriaceae bacterium]HQC93779.1 hypothetical protein [Microbacteriaceae bacterium]
MTTGDLFGGEAGQRRCARSGCTDDAVWAVVWRNPRIHAEDRRKIWTACEAHVAFLSEYLRARDFPVAVEPLEEDAS